MSQSFLCSELVTIHTTDQDGRYRCLTANLEEISPSSAVMNSETPFSEGVRVRVAHPKGYLTGRIEETWSDELGNYARVKLDSGSPWRKEVWEPGSLFNPQWLVGAGLRRVV